MKINALLISGIAMCLSTFAPATYAADANEDTKFAQEAAEDAMREVKLGELAEKQGGSDKVKAYGKMLATDHAAALKKLQTIAADKKITLPTELDKDDQKLVDKYSKLQGAEFDKDFIAAMLKDHKNDLSDVQEEAKDGKDAQIKAFAASMVPIVQKHLDTAKEIHAAMK